MKALLCALLVAGIILGTFFHSSAAQGTFVAYSLKEAERRLKESRMVITEVKEFGGITRFAGMVYDPAHGDVILVGQAKKGKKGVNLDHFAVALRALMIHKAWPLVSIDKTKETKETGRQNVRFEGGIAGSRFGKELLDADVVLKRLALDLLPAEVWGVRSYFRMSVERSEARGADEVIGARFWFDPIDNKLATRSGVFAIRGLRVGVRTEITNASVNGKQVENLSKVRDTVGDDFAAAMTAHYEELSGYYPEIGRVKALYDMVALAHGIKSLSPGPDMSYWLNSYRVAAVDTPVKYPLIKRQEQKQVDGKTRIIESEGGVELRAILLRLQDGDVTALRDAVLKSRPHERALTWRVPLQGWHIPGAPEREDEEPTDREEPVTDSGSMGTYIGREIRTVGLGGDTGSLLSAALPPRSATPWMPKVDFTSQIPPQRYATNVGGVMLRGSAQITGSREARLDLSGGNFSLIVEGQNAQLAPETLRKFITALWSVYYSKQDPGISIDPIAPGIDKHLVRYIGKVINSDLGRVMREGDYIMKKWAVGTEKPNIPGFKDVDELMARHGFRYVGASRRFWFVPEDMKFKMGDNMLLFESGRMTVKTEYVLQNKGVKAEPADEAFAKFFTEQYQAIAAKYPVYQELFEYAKLVALAKYLTEQGVPLFWFLMANKDLVLTEDSPGTVDALAKGSQYFRGIEIQGGVDLGFEGKYVFDQQAVRAISEAVSKLPANAYSRTTLSPDKDTPKIGSEPFSFSVGKNSYSVVPQHSLTSGKDRRGIRYQTDLAFRHNGQPGLELVRYYKPSNGQDRGEFGQGWHLFVPYRIKPAGSTRRQFLNAMIPEKMVLENLVTGGQEVLTFSTDRYSVAGYVPERIETSQVIGLFIMSNASYRLADKLGNEFWFNQAGYLTDMIFSRDQRVHFEYLKAFTDAFEQPPYKIQPADGERTLFLNVRIPERMKVEDVINGGTEVLIFSDKGKIAGYVPEEGGKGRFQILAMMSDTSFRLLDKTGNETAFSPAGEFTGMVISAERPMIKSVTHGNQRVDFTYALDASGQIMIARAYLSEGEEKGKAKYVVHYQYDGAGRLSRVTSSATELAELRNQPQKQTELARR